MTADDVNYIDINGWRDHIIFSSAHLISEYEKCGRLHGHTYTINAKIYGEKNKRGILVDFSLIKKLLMEIANKLDHRVLIPEKNGSIHVGETEIKMLSNGKKYVFPREDCILLPIEFTTAENLAEYILDDLIEKIGPPKNVKKIEIGVDEGFGQGAWIIKNL